MKDYYKILDVSRTASSEDIKKQYRRLARKYHPDVSSETNSTEKFQEIQEAYSVLKDESKRKLYDSGVDPNQPGGAGQQHGFHTYGPNDWRDNPFSGFNDIFEFFGRARHNQQRRQAYTTSITLEEAFSGTTRLVNNKQFNIPAGIRNGTRFLIDNDFFVIVHVVPHPKFKRTNDDLLVSIKINATEAMLGTKINIHMLDKTALQVTIPEGTQPGQVLRVKEKGMPNPEITTHRGDLLVQILVEIPKNLTKDQKDSIISIGYRNEIEV